MAVSGSFHDAVKGVSAVVHITIVMSFYKDLNQAIPTTIAGKLAALKATAKKDICRVLVYTSSSATVILSKPRRNFHIDINTWKDECIKAAWHHHRTKRAGSGRTTGPPRQGLKRPSGSYEE